VRQVNELKSRKIETSNASATKELKIDQLQSNMIAQENLVLREQIKMLEQKCRNFEEKIVELKLKEKSVNSDLTRNSTLATQTSFETKLQTTSSAAENDKENHEQATQRDPTIHPPLRVRLQKLSEKSVALKWDHNPNNANTDIAGYRIYINNLIRGTLRASDMIALINGIQEEGEYKILMKSFNEKAESGDSNYVITRVKKRPNAAHHDESATGDSEDNTSAILPKPTVHETAKKKPSENSQQSAVTHANTPIIMDKLRAVHNNHSSNSSANSSPPTQLPNFNTSSNIIDHRHTTSPPKKDKNLLWLAKERLGTEKDDSVASRLEKWKTENTENGHLSYKTVPFSSSRAQPFSMPKTSEKLMISTSPKELNNFAVNYKPPISPPRGPSPNGMSAKNANYNEIYSSNSSSGFEIQNPSPLLLNRQSSQSKHKKSSSVDLGLKNGKEQTQTSDGENNSEKPQIGSGNSPQSTNLLLNFAKSAKFSASEPNLSSSVGRSDGSGHVVRCANSNTKIDFVRKSISFGDDEEVNNEFNRSEEMGEDKDAFFDNKENLSSNENSFTRAKDTSFDGNRAQLAKINKNTVTSQNTSIEIM